MKRYRTGWSVFRALGAAACIIILAVWLVGFISALIRGVVAAAVAWTVAVAIMTSPITVSTWCSFKLSDRKHQHCHNCKYNLFGNETGVCPECGKRICRACGNTLPVEHQGKCPECGLNHDS